MLIIWRMVKLWTIVLMRFRKMRHWITQYPRDTALWKKVHNNMNGIIILFKKNSEDVDSTESS